MSELQTLDIARGGTGLNISLTIADADKVIKVNSTGTGLEVAVSPESPGSKLYNYNRLF